MTLDAMLERAFRDEGLAEITIRVSRYAADGKTPEAFQAIAKYRERITGPWGVGVMASPTAAGRRALGEPEPAATGGVFD